MTRSVHRKQRAIKPASTPQTQADMAKYYAMLRGGNPKCFLSSPNHIQRAANNCAECKFKHRCLG